MGTPNSSSLPRQSYRLTRRGLFLSARGQSLVEFRAVVLWPAPLVCFPGDRRFGRGRIFRRLSPSESATLTH